MPYVKSFENNQTKILDAYNLQAKAVIAKQAGDDASSRRFLKKANGLMREAGVILTGLESQTAAKADAQASAMKPRRKRRTRAEMEAARGAPVQSGKTVAATPSAAAVAQPERKRRAKFAFGPGDVVQISRGAPVHSDDPKTPHDGKPAGRTYKITVATVDAKNRTVGWKGNAGYNHWVHQDFITLVTKGASEAQASAAQVQHNPEPVPAE